MIDKLFSANFLVLLEKTVIIFALYEFFVKVRIEAYFINVNVVLKVKEIWVAFRYLVLFLLIPQLDCS